MSKVSVIVPVYNVEQYIKRCLKSILDQSWQDFEILCVDDCGQDQSISIIEQMQKEYPQKIKILYGEQNMGLGAARDRGMKAAYEMKDLCIDVWHLIRLLNLWHIPVTITI